VNDIRLAVHLDRFAYADGTVALEGIDLEIRRGEFCGLLGANGSGKTTLLKVMDGLIREYRGRVSLDGRDILDLQPREIYRQVGLVFQNPDDQLFAPSVAEDVAFGPRNMGFAEEEVQRRVAVALAQVELADLAAKNIHHLSFGQKKRACIAGLLAMGHGILLLDEPTAGLDPMSEHRMLELLARLNRDEGVTVVMATHSVDLVPLFLGRLHILSRGRLVRGGTPEEVFTAPVEMEQVRLRLPHIADLIWRLRHQDRLPFSRLPLTVGEARRELAALYDTVRDRTE
jgi:cobalt/nickel transport system ATP-binding protein